MVLKRIYTSYNNNLSVQEINFCLEICYKKYDLHWNIILWKCLMTKLIKYIIYENE